MLVSIVSTDEEKKFNIVKHVLEYLKPYMNLELYQYEKKQEVAKESEYVINNSAFEYQSKLGRSTGVAQSPKWVRDALEKHFEELETCKPKPVVWSKDSDELG